MNVFHTSRFSSASFSPSSSSSLCTTLSWISFCLESRCFWKEESKIISWDVEIFKKLKTNRLQCGGFGAYLYVSPLFWNRSGGVALVLDHSAHRANQLLVRPAVDVDQPVVLRAHLLLQWDCGRDQLVLLKHRNTVSRLEVSRTVRHQTRQAGHGGCIGFGLGAEITGDVRRDATGHSSRGGSLLGAQVLHKLGVTGKRWGRSWMTDLFWEISSTQKARVEWPNRAVKGAVPLKVPYSSSCEIKVSRCSF